MQYTIHVFGGPLASALMEEVIALGGKTIIACGGAGSLNPNLYLGQIIVPVSAIRDEGTSYHYLPPSREVHTNTHVLDIIFTYLNENNIDYLAGKTWTTDAVYRETINKVELRRTEGCLTVEMETATFIAVAEHHNIKFGQLLYAGDILSDGKWQPREWNNKFEIRKRLFEHACKICTLF